MRSLHWYHYTNVVLSHNPTSVSFLTNNGIIFTKLSKLWKVGLKLGCRLGDHTALANLAKPKYTQSHIKCRPQSKRENTK